MAHGRILLVEDEILIGRDLARRLRQWGYEVVDVVLSGEQAIEVARKERPNLIVMDIRLEGPMDGIDAAIKIRSEMDAAVIYLTAHSETSFFRRAKLSEPHGYLTKPVSMDAFRRAVEMALQKQQFERILVCQRDLGVGLAAASDLPEAWDMCVEYVLRMCEMEAAGFYTATDDCGFELSHQKGFSDETAAMLSRIEPDSPEAILMFSGKPAALYDDKTVSDGAIVAALRESEFVSASVAPIINRGIILGSLVVASREFSETPAQILQALEVAAGQAGGFVARLQAEDALRESEARFRQVAESIDEAFWIAELSPQPKVLYANPAVERQWGLRPEDFGPGIMGWLKFVHEDERAAITQAFTDFIQGAGDFDEEYRIVLRNGSTRWVSHRAFHVPDDKGRLYRIAGRVQDVTDSKSDQEKQAALVDEIQHFAYIVSHDLRGPLVNIRGLSRELREGLERANPRLLPALETLPEEERLEVNEFLDQDFPEVLDLINASVSRMNRLVDGILRLSRLGRMELVLETVDMDRLASQTLKSMGRRAKTLGAEVRLNSMPKVVADLTAMEQIMSNLLTNALNYLDPSRPGLVEIGGAVVGDETLIYVSDNGVGIEERNLKRVFEIFQRVGDSSVEGDGIGLTFVRTLVRRHGGRIWCESQPGVGSTFRFTVANDPSRIH